MDIASACNHKIELIACNYSMAMIHHKFIIYKLLLNTVMCHIYMYHLKVRTPLAIFVITFPANSVTYIRI